MTELVADTVVDVVDAADVVVCCGSGGVGKTTTAAVIGIEAAERGRRAVVVTIDPAKRLADSLGLEELPQLVATSEPRLELRRGYAERPELRDATRAPPSRLLGCLPLGEAEREVLPGVWAVSMTGEAARLGDNIHVMTGTGLITVEPPSTPVIRAYDDAEVLACQGRLLRLLREAS